jgi:hypothetical protein
MAWFKDRNFWGFGKNQHWFLRNNVENESRDTRLCIPAFTNAVILTAALIPDQQD